MRIRRSISGLCISLLLTLMAMTSTSAVEFGQDATGDPNAVHIQGNTSAFSILRESFSLLLMF